MSPFLSAVIVICLAALLVAAALCLYRMSIGPNAADRAVAFDSLAMIFICIVCIFCIRWNSMLYLDAVWILMLVGFLGSAAIARYLENGRVF
jgi:multisubunit Na+/H+ antiporter MnhF subunit